MTAHLAEPDLEHGGQPIDAAELARLMSTFNEVTGRLHETHDRLHREVHRLRAELAEANEQLQRSKRLAALGQMAAGIAHEVRNPLGCIQLYAQMLEADLAEQAEPRTLATKISGAVRGLDAIVGDVLTFAREIVARPVETDGVELVHRSRELACPRVPASIALDLPDTARTCRISCDHKLMQQALVNLIRNAVEAMEDVGGQGHCLKLDVHVTRPTEGRSTAILSVADTGPGMSQETIDRMFNPFFTTRHTGTGLGLAIVHRIVDAHRGHIAVRSRTIEASAVDCTPHGTTIELHLPQAGGGANQEARMANA